VLDKEIFGTVFAKPPPPPVLALLPSHAMLADYKPEVYYTYFYKNNFIRTRGSFLLQNLRTN